VTIKDDNWLNDRVVSIGYYALVEYSRVNPSPDEFTEVCAWKNIDALPTMLFDHREMIERALRTLRLQLNYRPVGYELLPQKFTMGELQRLYETLIGHTLDRGNFRKKMVATGVLRRTGERPTGRAHKTPHLYSFDKRIYARSFEDGLSFGK
jgi:8-oxo-dGTP diphosphatase